MSDKVIPIKYGGPHDNVEAHANTETGEVEAGAWKDGPSNTFHHNQSRVVSLPSSKAYRDNYERIFGHD